MRRPGPALLVVLVLALAGALAGCGGAAQEPPQPEAFPEGAAARIEDPGELSRPLGTAVTWTTLADDEQLQAVVERAFDSVTPENEMKMEVVQPSRGDFKFSGADALVDWARERDKLVRGHTLVWHQQTPDWLADVDRPELETVLREHVGTVVERYRGRVSTWDVVNEPFTDAGGLRSEKGFPFVDALGAGYIEVALRAAREADPDARLVVNEIGAESGGPKLEALVRMVRELRRRDVPLDAVGLEAHLTTEAPPSRATLQRTIERLVAAGVDVELTELDVAAPGDAAAEQARVYRDAAAACAAVERCRRVTIWGVSDRDSWLGADQQGLPFDAELRPKPAWDALTRALATRERE